MPGPASKATSWSDIRAQVLQATDLVDLVGRSVRLIRRGRDFFGLCPFHQEKSPSFKVSPANQYFYCFGCKASGTALDFVMRRDRVEYRDALRLLADQGGIPLPTSGARESTSRRQSLLEAHSAAASVFQKHLQDPQAGAAARSYLAERGFTDAAVRDFHIGVAPVAWDALLTNPAMRKFPPALLAEAGLAKPRTNGEGYYDTFRNRLIFPIRDEAGRVIAFGGRVMPNSDDPAKYLNSPETPLFSKSRCVYGLDKARQAIVDSRTVAVVEGYTDVVMAHQHGVANVVSVLGTAMTEQHVAILRRFADRIVLLFDADAAGDAAVTRVVELFLTQPVEIAVATMPDGLDPDELLLKQGPEAFRAVVAAADDALSFQWRRLVRDLGDSPDLTSQQRAVTRYLELLAAARGAGPVDDVRWGAALARVSRLTDIPVESLHRRFPRAARRARRPRQQSDSVRPPAMGAPTRPDSSPAVPVDPARIRAECNILGLLLLDPSFWIKVQTEIEPADFADPGCRALALAYWQHQRDLGAPVLRDFVSLLAEQSPAPSETYGSSQDAVEFDGPASNAQDFASSTVRPADLAIRLAEMLEAALDSAAPPGKTEPISAGEEDQTPSMDQARRAEIERCLWLDVEYLLRPRTQNPQRQALVDLKSGKSGSAADEVDLLRQIAQGAKESSRRRENL